VATGLTLVVRKLCECQKQHISPFENEMGSSRHGPCSALLAKSLTAVEAVVAHGEVTTLVSSPSLAGARSASSGFAFQFSFPACPHSVSAATANLALPCFHFPSLFPAVP